MNLNELITTLLQVVNEILAAAIVIIAASLLLYNLTRNLTNRVARSSGIVLAAVTFAYLCDVYLSLDPDTETTQAALRLQWIGIAFIPAALFHLSDALLATTGLPSRGRRRRVVRILYLISGLFLLAVPFTGWVIVPVIHPSGRVILEGRWLFYVYILYFLIASIATFINVQRARKRCLTPSSQRRMAYLQMTILTPALGIFPYSVLLNPSDDVVLTIQLLVNIANIIVILMLLFLSYPLSFFGSDTPDRVVKVELLRFQLRGPGTGLLVLAVIIFTRTSIEILGLRAVDFMPFAVVAVVLLWQWAIALGLPYLEKWFIYNDEDHEQLAKLQDLSDRVLTRKDLQQLIAATLEAFCDYLRTEVAFVATRTNEKRLEFVQTLGPLRMSDQDLETCSSELLTRAASAERVAGRSAFQTWEDYQVVPLYSKRSNNGTLTPLPIGVMAIEVMADPVQLVEDPEDTDLIYAYVQRAEQTLDDILLQDEVFAALEGLLPQFHMTRQRANEVEYRAGRQKMRLQELPNRDELYEQVRAALRHYWGGPGMTRSRMFDLLIVQQTLADSETPVQALRAVLQDAIEKLRPDGERSMTGPEWTLYNILDLRFIERKKVREVAHRMSISEPDLYRKQRLAIETLAETILEREREIMTP